MTPPLLSLVALLSPVPQLPARMPPAAAACLEAIARPALPSAADRKLPGPCRSQGASPESFAYFEGERPLGGLPGPEAVRVELDAQGRPVRQRSLTGPAQVERLWTWSGGFLQAEVERPAPGATCRPTVQIRYQMDDFGRPAGHTRTAQACDGTLATTTRRLVWAADGVAEISGTEGEGLRAQGVFGSEGYHVECFAGRCACERRSYDAHHNLLRTVSRAADGAVTSEQFDFACWPPAAAEAAPAPGVALRGRALYDQYCQTCHGPTGVGDGPAGAGLKVRNLVALGDEMCGQDNGILAAIRDGIGQMPGFPQLDEGQRRDILAYIRVLQARGRGRAGAEAP